jgi:subtilisin family serine protease
VRTTHQEFTGRTAPGFSAYSDTCLDGNGDGDGHGTHVAGTVGGTNAGVAKNVTIVPVRVFSCTGSGTAAALVAGINWIIVNHGAGEKAVANLSLTVGGANEAVDAAVEALIADGVTVIVASGNSTADSCSSSPARVANAITVNASTRSDTAASFSNYGACTDIYAPGVDIWSAWNTSNDLYANLDGTSMAAPLVAGVAAVILSEGANQTPADLTALVLGRATSKNILPALANDAKLLLTNLPLIAFTSSPTPVLSGSLMVGGTLEASVGGWSPVPSVSGWEWLRDGVVVSGEVGSSYVLTAADVGSRMSVRFSGSRTGYAAASRTSLATSDVIAVSTEFAPVVPTRIVDTRPGYATADGQIQGVGAVGPGQTLRVPILGRGGLAVPSSGVSAVVVNVTAVGPTAGGHATVYPTNEEPPEASNVNFTAGQTIPNLVVAKIGDDGSISIENASSGSTNFLVDVAGYFPEVLGYEPLVPARLADTRPPSPTGKIYETVDGQIQGVGAVGPGQSLRIPVLDRGGVLESGVSAVVVNVTAVGPTANGHATVYPSDEEPPEASNVNFLAGQTIPNLVIAKVSADGFISIYNSAGYTNFVVDVAGYFPEVSAYDALVPARLVDTRPGYGTPDGQIAGVGAVGPGQTLRVPVLGRGGVDLSDVSAVVVNVTAVGPTAGGHATVYPTGEAVPNASNVNFTAGQTIPNLVIAKVGADGSISIFNSGGYTNFVVDVAGYVTNLRDP